MAMWSYLWRMAAALLLVLPLVYLATRIYAQQGWQARQGRWLKIIEVCPLNQRNQLVVAKIADQIVVLGVSDHGFQVLATLEGEIPTEFDQVGGGGLGLKLWAGIQQVWKEWWKRPKQEERENEPMAVSPASSLSAEEAIRAKIERIRKINLQQDGEGHDQS